MLESKHLRSMILVTFIAILLIISATLIIANYRNNISQKPIAPSEKQPDDEDLDWYIRFSVEDQQATGYVAEAYSPITSSGEVCFIGGVAMHPVYPINAGGDPLIPAIPFGTTLYLDKPINVQGKEYTSFQVMDTGDVYYGLWPEYPYWVDIYFGTANYYNRLDAINFGTEKVSYYWIEEWR
ncbi:hypothetical protein ASZ90_018632 [hydrocarbon metagenome]|uniref:Uncharacterized protein n=1 Tax=hydrocarbon metagenome TaxID=938273 RepID=A0A0W8E6D7_9ZZZZ